MYYYDLVFKETRSRQVVEIAQFSNFKKYSQVEFNSMIKRWRQESYNSQEGERSKYEAFDYIVDKLIEDGFEKKVVFEF